MGEQKDRTRGKWRRDGWHRRLSHCLEYERICICAFGVPGPCFVRMILEDFLLHCEAMWRGRDGYRKY